MRALILPAIFLMLILPLIHSAEVKGHVLTVQPIKKQIFEGDTLDLGIVGPGQKIELEISRSSNIFDFRDVEETWDRLIIDDDTLPDFWKSEYSKRYEANPKAFVIVYGDAPDGDYTFALSTDRDYSTPSQNPVKFFVRVRVTRDVLGIEVMSKLVKGGVEQPSEFEIRLTNKGSASDAFNLEVVSGLPNSWKFKKQVFVPHNEERIVQYEVVAAEQVDAQVEFKATSLSSDSIYATDSGGLQTRSSVLQDMKSVGNGVILFPYIEQAVYYLMGFIANNFF